MDSPPTWWPAADLAGASVRSRCRTSWPAWWCWSSCTGRARSCAASRITSDRSGNREQARQDDRVVRAWFGEEYLQLYPHRDAAEAERAVSLIGAAPRWTSGWRVLDVACGPGRHAAGARGRRARCRRARSVERAAAPRPRGDARSAGAGRHAALPIRARLDGSSLNLFTSFGYFESDAEHAATLAEMVATLRPRRMVRDGLPQCGGGARSARAAGGGPVACRGSGEAGCGNTFRPTSGTCCKTIHLAGRPALHRAGATVRRRGARGDARRGRVTVEQRFGDYDGAPLAPARRARSCSGSAA